MATPVAYRIAELTEVADLQEVVNLFAQVWGGEAPINSNTLRALSHSGNYLAGARSDGRLIGAVMGWLGGHPPHDLHLHSHILAVVPDIEARGLGFALKQHQRDWCLARQVPVVEWTFDPLVRRNAYFNLTKLAAGAARYLINFYGPMEDSINAGDESDRILIRWDLDSEKARAAAAGRAVEQEAVDGMPKALRVSGDGEPDAHAVRGSSALVQVPDDIVAIRKSNPALARRWRNAVRAVLGDAMSSGYRVTGATRDGWYVLRSSPH